MANADLVDPVQVPDTIGDKYRVVRPLGTGGMGTVYEAENTWTRRRVAIKLLHPRYAQTEEFTRRFMLEAQSAAQVAHPNTVDVLDMGLDAALGSLFIVQEFLTGEDLRVWLDRRKRLPPREALDLIVPIADVLVAAHARGIVHRDIKPENIFLALSPSGERIPKLIDFGISKVLGEDGSRHLTHVGTTVGTPHYMSPEQVRGEASIDGRSDVWSLGAVLYEMVAGETPFDAPNHNLVVHAILTERAPRIEQRVPDAPRDLGDLLARALEPDRDLRFADARDFLTAAATCLDELGGPIGHSLLPRHRSTFRTASVGPPSADATERTPPVQVPTELLAPVAGVAPSVRPPGRGERLSRPVALTAAVLCGAVVGAAALVSVRDAAPSGSSRPPPPTRPPEVTAAGPAAVAAPAPPPAQVTVASDIVVPEHATAALEPGSAASAPDAGVTASPTPQPAALPRIACTLPPPTTSAPRRPASRAAPAPVPAPEDTPSVTAADAAVGELRRRIRIE